MLGQGRLLIESLRLRFGFGTGRVDAIVPPSTARAGAGDRPAPPRKRLEGRHARPPALHPRARDDLCSRGSRHDPRLNASAWRDVRAADGRVRCVSVQQSAPMT